MVEFVFVNPSPNMELVAQAARNAGRNAASVFTRDYVDKKPDNLWAFIDGQSVCLSDRTHTQTDPAITAMKKPMFASLRTRSVNDKLSGVNPFLKHGAFQDLVLLTGGFRKGSVSAATVSDMSFEQVLARYPAATVVTAEMASSSGRYIATRWRTDYDIREALGNDYFFLFDGVNRYELYSLGDEMMTVSGFSVNISRIKELNPAMSHFAFEPLKSVAFHQNRNPWIEKHSNVVILNDYSWRGVSVNLPPAWEKAVAKALFTDKKKK